MSARYPGVEVPLTGEDVTPQAIMGRVCRALADAGVPQEEIDQLTAEALPSPDRDHLLAVCRRWVRVT